jgi:uncharacterized integral membrane protein
MQRKLIFLVLFMILIAVFALQNSNVVQIKLWFWNAETSMALILILSFGFGAIAGILFSLPAWRKKQKKSIPPGTADGPDAVSGIQQPGRPAGDPEESSGEVPLEVKDPDDEFEDVGNKY